MIDLLGTQLEHAQARLEPPERDGRLDLEVAAWQLETSIDECDRTIRSSDHLPWGRRSVLTLMLPVDSPRPLQAASCHRGRPPRRRGAARGTAGACGGATID